MRSTKLLVAAVAASSSVAFAQEASRTKICPSEVTVFNAVSGEIKSRTFAIGALKEKIYTKAELEEYLRDLESTFAKAQAKQASGQAYISYYDTGHENGYENSLYCPKDYQLDRASASISCSEILYDFRYRDSWMDTLTPRLDVYRCHQQAGWPTAKGQPKRKSYTIGK